MNLDMHGALNPILYGSLKEAFGQVRISNEREQIQFRYRPNWLHRQGRIQAEVASAGETYYVNCPFCNDTRKRLGISYHWSVWDEETDDNMLHLAHCFNENCISTREIQKKLHALVYPDGTYGQTMTVRLSSSPPSLPAAPRRFLLPEGTLLSELPDDHSAIKYLQRRKFDPKRLAKRWGVRYCQANIIEPGRASRCRPYFQDKRLVYPIFAPSLAIDPERVTACRAVRLAGWQARALTDRLARNVPKYFSAAGMKKSELLYGLPAALVADGPLVVVEGVTDVWRVGPGAVALFGKTISPAQVKLILRHCPGRPLVVLLDADATDNARRVCQQIRSGRLVAGDNTPVDIGKLPTGRKDPGECTHAEVWKVIQQAVKRGKQRA
jgi:hypothetical protein